MIRETTTFDFMTDHRSDRSQKWRSTIRAGLCERTRHTCVKRRRRRRRRHRDRIEVRRGGHHPSATGLPSICQLIKTSLSLFFMLYSGCTRRVAGSTSGSTPIAGFLLKEIWHFRFWQWCLPRLFQILLLSAFGTDTMPRVFMCYLATRSCVHGCS